MDEESNPIKDYLFEYIENSETIPKLIIEKKFDEIIQEITTNCYDKVISIGEKDEAVGVLATGLLHYLLTNALINSQRKIEYNENEIDIVIPDIKTLEKDPKKTLLICIPKSSDATIINKKIIDLEKIQPETDNIWLVLSENIQTQKKSFVLKKENNSFSKIIFEIAKFSNVGGSNKFKILRV
ncbi:hypothetical protein [Candidatus Nitrosopumilus sediminis]|uniref:Uncharacterized protein n=1 Tax=Candidatus Nitrosopumilus sediminis TaxID=1229909 RepID=K0BED2_9ARCH|nr:hypothetical protein [Candidatus Nitrosopumilus sediminis]AFS82716.1 hypothetical protein NSED_04550 [Candidatus Nitrosopumilus sediminis]